MLRVYNMTSPRSGREVANQFVIVNDSKVMFQSYDSPIVEIDHANNVLTVFKNWNYSMTTSKYRNEFMSEYGFDEMSSKQGFVKGINEGEATTRYGIKYKVVEA